MTGSAVFAGVRSACIVRVTVSPIVRFFRCFRIARARYGRVRKPDSISSRMGKSLLTQQLRDFQRIRLDRFWRMRRVGCGSEQLEAGLLSLMVINFVRFQLLTV